MTSSAPRLLRVFLSVARQRTASLKPSPVFRNPTTLQNFNSSITGHCITSPWQSMLTRSLATGRGGGDDDDLFGKFGKNKSRNGNGDDEPRLFGEGGLFGRPSGRSPDDWDKPDADEAPSEWTSFTPKQEDFDDVDGDYVDGTWTADGAEGPTVEEYIPGSEPLQAEDGSWTTVVSEKGFGSEGATAAAPGDVPYDWISQEGKGPAYIGKWGPDGRLLKVKDQELRGYAPAEDDPTSNAAFGDLIRKSGYTDDDIANLMAGFYESAGLPHLDDYKYVDMDAERRKKRRDMELEKMAEMAKRWVKKVDEQGFAHGVGRRKTSSARIWIREGQGRIVINKKHHDLYFPNMDDRVQYLEPFVVTDTLGMFDAFVLVRGGGTTGQAGAVRHGLSRALMWYEPTLRPVLKKAGMLTRDPRMVERKKPGKAKARRSFQWVKR